MPKKILIALLLVFVAQLLFRIYTYREEYTTKYDSSYWKKRYEQSQWNSQIGCIDFDPHINPKTCVWDDAWYQSKGKFLKIEKREASIGDDGLYAYTGWEYIYGKDPTLLNAEMPPLGKYLIGVSILVFGNQNIFALLSGLVSLGALFLVSKKILKNTTLAFLPVLLFSFEPLFYSQLRAPYLDLLYLSFLSFTIYFILKKNYIVSSIFLGFMMATKASLASFVTVVVTTILYFLIIRNFNTLKKFVMCLPVSIIIFSLVYIRYFLLGHTIIDFLKVQKWVFEFYTSGAKGVFGSVFEMLLIGRWNTWFGTTTRVNEWMITWPIVIILSLILLVIYIKKKKFDESFLLFSWVGIYILFLLTVPVFPRYFLVLIPFIYILAIEAIKVLKKKYK